MAGRKIKCAKCTDVIRLPTERGGAALLVRKGDAAANPSRPAAAPAVRPPPPPARPPARAASPPPSTEDAPLSMDEPSLTETPLAKKPAPRAAAPPPPPKAKADDDMPLLLEEPEPAAKGHSLPPAPPPLQEAAPAVIDRLAELAEVPPAPADDDGPLLLADEEPPAKPPAPPRASTPPPPPATKSKRKAEPEPEAESVDLFAAATSDAPEPEGGLDLFGAAPAESAAEEKGAYDISELVESKPTRPSSAPAASAAGAGLAPAAEEEGPADGPQCPSCDRRLRREAKICSACGIKIDSGRPLITSQSGDLNELYVKTETVVTSLSWILRFGLFPVSSEALGSRKKYAVGAITVITIIISAWFLVMGMFGGEEMRSYKNLMMWAGDGKAQAPRLKAYAMGHFGDTAAFAAKIKEIEADREKAAASQPEGLHPPVQAPMGHARPHAPSRDADDDEDFELDGHGASADSMTILFAPSDVVVEAHDSLRPDQRVTGDFEPYQLITHAFLHGGIMHLVGNLVFFLVFGSRINAFIGSIGTTVAYLFLAICAGIAHLLASSGEPPVPLVGASGAIMGMAGMYFVFFPAQRVHSVIWLRLGIFTGFRLWMKIFELRGYWVLLFYIFFDILYTLLGVKDGTAHWAHLGGFFSGMAVAIILLATRGVNGRGSDLLSILLGRWAWPLIGKPSQWALRGTDEGWVQRLHLPVGGKRAEGAEAKAPAAPRAAKAASKPPQKAP